MYRRIAVALDTGPERRHALRWAIMIARRANCPLDLVRVAVPPVHGSDLFAAAVLSDADVERLERDARQELRDVADEASSAGVRATPVVLRGSVPSALADHLRGSEADLIVMTTHDRGRLERLLLGSVSEAVTRHAHVPTLLVRVRAHEEDGYTVTDAEPEVRRILVPLDGSPFGEQILPPAATLATLMNASVTLLGVVEPMLASAAFATGIDGAPVAPFDAQPVDPEGDEERLGLESEALERTAARLRSLGLSIDVRVLMDGRPAHAIVEFASQHDIDLIAMTTHGRGALKRLVAGSVTEAVLRAAATHLLLYRPEHPAPS
jgi:nucleotide-binding universal stress UspA family protein